MNQFFQNQPQYTPQQIKQMQAQYQQAQIYKAQVKYQKNQQLKDIRKVGFALGTAIVLYLAIQTVCIGVLKANGLMDVYNASPLFQNCANIIIVHFMSMLVPFSIMALALRKNFISPLIPTKNVGKRAFAWYALGMGGCTLANYTTAIIMTVVKETTKYELTQPSIDKPNTIFTLFITILSTAIIPGICEEIAFRGAAMGVLRKYGKGFAVIAVSVAFGLVHGNIIQFIFAFLVGLILAYITIKTDNILIAMCIHATNNGISVLQDFFNYFKLSSDVSDVIISVIYIAFGCLGIISAIYLGRKKDLFMKKEAKNPFDNSLGRKLVALIPGLFVPFTFLIIMTISTIVKQ